MRLPHSDKSTDMQHNLFKSGHDLDLGSNLKVDISRLKYILFNAARQEKDVDVMTIILSFLSPKLSLEINGRPLPQFDFIFFAPEG